MAKTPSNNKLASERTDLAEDRTEWAEDRTIMANERTFAGWMRTGLAAVGIGLGFNALFGKLEPFWVPKAIASLFMGIGIFIFWAAQRNGCAVQSRLDSHKATPVKPNNMRLISGLMAMGAITLIVAIWAMDFND
ncbi:YidH family protein [Parasphingorhabdus sp.]|uniref:YidH family protein n=1 Tax=Parasphingorhabdus sp. TaxID=2709688 RepID=UPI003A9206BD